MPESITFDLISPERILFSGPARMVTIPGEAGEFGVLPSHMPLLSALKPGVLSVEIDGESAVRRLFVAGGFADVTPGRCVVLAEESVPVETLDRAEIEAGLRVLQEDRSVAVKDAERKKLDARIEIERARAQAARTS